MSAFEFQKLFSRERDNFTIGEIIRWWEIRRLVFNGCVGSAGVLAGAVMFTTGWIMESKGYEAIGIPDPPIFAFVGAFIYAVMANFCYTGGWVSELVARRIWGRESSSYAKIAFALGLGGSTLLTVLPAVLTVLVALSVFIAGSPKSH